MTKRVTADRYFCWSWKISTNRGGCTKEWPIFHRYCWNPWWVIRCWGWYRCLLLFCSCLCSRRSSSSRFRGSSHHISSIWLGLKDTDLPLVGLSSRRGFIFQCRWILWPLRILFGCIHRLLSTCSLFLRSSCSRMLKTSDRWNGTTFPCIPTVASGYNPATPVYNSTAKPTYPFPYIFAIELLQFYDIRITLLFGLLQCII